MSIGILPIVGLSGAAIVAAGSMMMEKRRRERRARELLASMTARAYQVRREQFERPRGTFIYRPAIEHAARRRLNHLRGVQFNFRDLEPFIR